MKRIHALAALITLLLAIPPAQAENPQPVQNNPQTLETYFVQFTPNFPLKPGSLNLFHYETEKAAKGFTILSPDKKWMTASEVFFLPTNRQTLSRVGLYPVGPPPAEDQYIYPKANAYRHRDQERHPGKLSEIQNGVDLKDVNPQAFWARYQPEKQIANRKIIYDAGFKRHEDYRFDTIQPVDWSADGTKLLMVHRPGVHHLGIYRTYPVIYDLTAQELIRYTFLPEQIWQEHQTKIPVTSRYPEPLWDIRPLGWRKDKPQELVVKLVVFQGQSEESVGFWSVDTATHQQTWLGDMITPDIIAKNGWLVTFKDPAAPEGPKVYVPGEKLPEKTDTAARDRPKPAKRNGILFWHK